MSNLTRRAALASVACAPFASAAFAQVLPPRGMRCSRGWFVTGYYTASELEYAGVPAAIEIDGTRYSFPSDFLHKVKTDGWGETRHRWFLGWNNGWRKGDAPLTAKGEALSIGCVAVDRKLVPLGTHLRILDLPPPWNARDFIAADIGGGIAGKRLDVYCGCGSDKRPEALRLTAHDLTVCLGDRIA